MELTREEIEKLADGSGYRGMMIYTGSEMQKIASMLLAEMDKPKVWEHAKDDDVLAVVSYAKHEQGRPIVTANYYRSLPKSPERKIAEKWGNKITDKHNVKDQAIGLIESAINEYKEKVK